LAGVTNEGLSAQSVFEKAAAGDATARQVVDESVSFLAGGIVNVCAVLAPELVVLGGGVARAGAALVDPVRERLEKALPAPPRLVLSELGDAASVTGAVRLALDEADRREFFFHLSEPGRRSAGGAG
jgi:predicted NBD/HSP70 family sugar kinase